MNIRIDTRDQSRIAIVEDRRLLIQNAQDALDLMATIHHIHDCRRFVLYQEAIDESFFDLSSGLAGEVLQKFTNYGTRCAIVGDFSAYTSKSLRDFIRESNRGNQNYFLPTIQQALDALHT